MFPRLPEAGHTGIGRMRRAAMGGAKRKTIGRVRRWAGRARGDWRDAARRGECAGERA